MSIIPQLLPIEINHEKRKNTVLTNIVKMLSNRGIINASTPEEITKESDKLIKQEPDDFVYKIKIDNPEKYYGSEKKEDTEYFWIKLLNQKVTSIAKVSNIGDFIYAHRNHPKIIIVSNVTAKALSQLESEFPNTEVFLEREFMIDIVSYIMVPKHELLTEEDSKKVLEEYILKKRQVPKMFVYDAISKYYKAKPGQMFRIIRPSEIAGQAFYYRLVVR